jgi:glycosyltransferase involved in cell wall biosynthesis
MEKIFALGLDKQCRWLGTLPHERVIGEFEQADVFVLGCRVAKNGDRDGIPNVLVESLAMGLPAVATTVSALPEIIRQNETGLLVPPDSPDQLAKTLITMLTDNELRKRCIRNGRELVAERFDNRRLIKNLAAVYREGIPALTKAPCV